MFPEDNSLLRTQVQKATAFLGVLSCSRAVSLGKDALDAVGLEAVPAAEAFSGRRVRLDG